jgi:uncharacterized low-complexity protein
MAPVVVAGIVAGAMSLGSMIFGGVKARKARQRQEKLLRSQEIENRALFEKEYYTPYAQSEEAQNSLAVLRENLKEQSKQTAQSQAISGASDEAKIGAQLRQYDEKSGSSWYSKQIQCSKKLPEPKVGYS